MKSMPAEQTTVAIGDRVHIRTSVGAEITESRLVRGIIVECPSNVEEMVKRRSPPVVTALFDISLAGDVPEGYT